jgi:hypothetical protein
MYAATNALFSPTDQRMHRVIRVSECLRVRSAQPE